MRFKYVATTSVACKSGTPDTIKGRLTADDLEQCLAKLSNMGLSPVVIELEGDDGQLSKIWPAESDQSADAMDETEEVAEEPAKSQPDRVPPHVEAQVEAASRNMPSLPSKPAFLDKPDERRIPAITRQELEAVYGRPRRQSLYMGEYKEIKGLVDKALDANGVVKHMAIHPNLNGHLILAVAIEHEEEA